MKDLNPRIVCQDGFTMSVQASAFAYASPREDHGPYSAVECGFPSQKPSAALMEYAENPDDPTGTVYGYVPVAIVLAEFELHGGIETGKMPE